MPNTRSVQLIDADTRVTFADDLKSLTRRVSQTIPSSFLDRLRDSRVASANTRAGEFHHVASIPVAIVEQWMAEGFNVFDQNVTAQEILKRLNSEDMGAFLATSKTI